MELEQSSLGQGIGSHDLGVQLDQVSTGTLESSDNRFRLVSLASGIAPVLVTHQQSTQLRAPPHPKIVPRSHLQNVIDRTLMALVCFYLAHRGLTGGRSIPTVEPGWGWCSRFLKPQCNLSLIHI